MHRPNEDRALHDGVEEERSELLHLVRALSLKRGRFVLASGAVSDYYLDLRLTTTHPRGAYLAARTLLREASRRTATRIGGPTLGADPLVGAAAVLSRGPDRVRGFMVRPQAKDHGTGKQIEGHLEPGDRALVFDDVVTAGGSILRAVEAVRGHGAEVVGTWCLVDRNQGGREKLAEAGAPLESAFTVAEILDETVSPPDRPLETTGRRFRPETPFLTVDAIVEPTPGEILLVERRHPPHGWALPGGFVDVGESAEDAVRRELLEETGLRASGLWQMHTYSEPGRDPRMHTAAVVFVARASGRPKAGDDAAAVRAFPLDALPEDLCFDHRRVLQDFRERRFGAPSF